LNGKVQANKISLDKTLTCDTAVQSTQSILKKIERISFKSIQPASYPISVIEIKSHDSSHGGHKMVARDDLIYRQVITLKDGTRVLLRPLIKDDRQALLDLFLPVSADDLRYMRHKVNNQEVAESWIDGLNYEKVLPLVALIGDRIVGIATLQFGEGPARHKAEIRIFLAKEIRRRGVGSHLLQGTIDIAKRRNLYLLEVQIVSDQTPLIRAFQNAGFKTKTIFEDYFMFPDGDLADVAHLTLHLKSTDVLF
jgi:RimJ/RimL family protein N-acetyltransferase